MKQDAGGSILYDPHFSCSGSDCSTTISANAMNEFATKINVAKNCGTGMGCLQNTFLKDTVGNIVSSHTDYASNGWYGKVILTDGSFARISINSSNCKTNSSQHKSICGYLHIDINGMLEPNQYGKDVLSFAITKTGMYPCDPAKKVLTEGKLDY